MRNQKKRTPNNKKKKKALGKRLFRLTLLTVVVGLIAAIVLAGGLVIYSMATIPAYDPSRLDADVASKIYDIHGIEIATLHATENRTIVPLEQIPVYLQKAVLAMEDARFYSHPGFDIRGITRGLIRTLTGQRMEGGSTITNQLAKMAFLEPDRKITRKIQEFFLSLKLERSYTKDEILEFYLNRLFLGGSSYGVQEASRFYFGKDVWDLNLAESAMLAGIIPAPNAYRPDHNLDRAVLLQRTTLQNMVRFGFISEEERQEALQYEITVIGRHANNNNDPNLTGYFVTYVREQAVELLMKQGHSRRDAQDAIYKGGLHIYTTLDMGMQRAAEQAMTDGIAQWLVPNLENRNQVNSRGILQPQSSMILLDVKTGGIRAMVGGRDFRNDQHNRTIQLLKQQPGSAIKPITVFGPALERGLSPATVIDDAPLFELGTNRSPYPVNYSGRYLGLVSFRYAAQESLNVPAWLMGKGNGVNNMIEFAKRVGITTLVESPINGADDRNLAALTLGGTTSGVTPIEMAQAYATFANSGIRNDYYAIQEIKDHRGITIYRHRNRSQVALSEEVAYMMTSMLEDVINIGTGRFVRTLGGYQGPAAGKTGTSNFNRDAWFVGYTPEIAGAVHIGHDDNTTGNLARDPNSPNARGRLPGGSSSYISAAIFGRAMNTIYSNAEFTAATEFYAQRPANIVGPIAVSKRSGLLPGEHCPPDEIVYEEFIRGTEPTETCTLHVQVKVCTIHGQLASEFCPPETVRTVVRIRRPDYATHWTGDDGRTHAVSPPADASLAVPKSYCTYHKAPQLPTERPDADISPPPTPDPISPPDAEPDD